MKKGIFSILIVFVTLSSCLYESEDVPKDAGLLQVDSMAIILADLHLIEVMRQGGKLMAFEEEFVPNLNHVFTKHKIDSTRFLNSLEYYNQNKHLFRKVYDKILEYYASQQAKLSGTPHSDSTQLKTKPN
jgi:hypothetical protein